MFMKMQGISINGELTSENYQGLTLIPENGISTNS
jgi:hypothetical protein